MQKYICYLAVLHSSSNVLIKDALLTTEIVTVEKKGESLWLVVYWKLKQFGYWSAFWAMLYEQTSFWAKYGVFVWWII